MSMLISNRNDNKDYASKVMLSQLNHQMKDVHDYMSSLRNKYVISTPKYSASDVTPRTSATPNRWTDANSSNIPCMPGSASTPRSYGRSSSTNTPNSSFAPRIRNYNN